MGQTSTEKQFEGTDSNSVMNALVGAVVILVTSPLLPFAAIVGGGVAGYLERGSLANGGRVGALSGVIAAIPSFIVVWYIIANLLLGTVHLSQVTSLLGVGVFVSVFGYLGLAGAFGGALGTYLRTQM